MKKIIVAAMSLILTGAAVSAQDIVIRIDDMGSSHSANTACIDTYANGIARSVEVMPVCSWFPEAVKMLKNHPGLDVGVHLTLTSEWENVKWRPLTDCPSLVDENGYFFPMLSPHKAYPGQSVKEQKINIAEVEKEFRAQIELALANIPQVTHLTGHMGATSFSEEVLEVVEKLSKEYCLPSIDNSSAVEKYNFKRVGYEGPHATFDEKKASFMKMLSGLEKGNRYMFLDHPAYNDSEMAPVFHIGYEHVAADRQGVTDLLKDKDVMKFIQDSGIRLIDFNYLTKQLPRAEAGAKFDKAAARYIEEVIKDESQDIHSIMVIKDGKVIFEKWMSTGNELEPHILNSVSKTFTSTAVGLAISEGKLSLDDKVISFFPDKLPENLNENVAKMTVRNLLTMNTGHEKDPSPLRNVEQDWERCFLASDLKREPGTIFCYNSLATYMLSAIVQRVTGENLVDYLYPRVFRPLGINNAKWDESPTGVKTAGWGLYLKTEDLAKLGQLLLQNGEWEGRQIVPAEWVKAMSSAQVPCVPAGTNTDKLPEMLKDAKNSDWLQGYGYQMWRCRHNAFRADGAGGQYIIVIPDKNAVIVTTAQVRGMQNEINCIWKHFLLVL